MKIIKKKNQSIEYPLCYPNYYDNTLFLHIVYVSVLPGNVDLFICCISNCVFMGKLGEAFNFR